MRLCDCRHGRMKESPTERPRISVTGGELPSALHRQRLIGEKCPFDAYYSDMIGTIASAVTTIATKLGQASINGSDASARFVRPFAIKTMIGMSVGRVVGAASKA